MNRVDTAEGIMNVIKESANDWPKDQLKVCVNKYIHAFFNHSL